MKSLWNWFTRPPVDGPAAILILRLMTHFVAVLEIVGGLCLMLGLFTRVFSTLFIIEMLVAMLSTKISMYMGTFPLPIASPPKVDIWAVLHEIRSEYAQMLTCIFYCIVGPGILSLDARLRKKVSGYTSTLKQPQETVAPSPRKVYPEITQ